MLSVAHKQYNAGRYKDALATCETIYQMDAYRTDNLLLLGAKGYLVKPFTRDSLDLSVTLATKGEPIPDIVRQARDRNEALVAIMMSSLDRLATVHRQAKQFETALRERPRAQAAFRRASDLAQMFAKGGEDGLADALERFCVEKSKGPATRLGRLRKRLSSTRVIEDGTLE